MNYLFQRHSGVGISLFNDRLEMAHVRYRGGMIEILSHKIILFSKSVYDSGQIKNAEKFAFELDKTFRNLKLPRKGITICLPTPVTVVRILTMPRVNRKQMKEMLDVQLQEDIRIPFANPTYDFDYLPTSIALEIGPRAIGDEVPILLIASQQKVITELSLSFQKAGLRLDAIESKGLSIVRALKAMDKFPGKGTIVVEFEADRLDAHFYVNGVLLMTRSMFVAPNLIDHCRKNNPGDDWTLLGKMSESESLDSFVSEIGYRFNRWITLFQYSLNQRVSMIESIWLTRQFPHSERLMNILSQSLNVSVSILSIPKLNRTYEKPIEMTSFSTAGAGLRGQISDAD